MVVQHERLRVAAGDVTAGEAALHDVVRGQDAVISALGRGTSFKADRLMQRAVPSIISTMQANRVRRLIVESAMGVGITSQDAPIIPRILHRTLLRDIFADKRAAEELITRSDLDWTIVHPTGLTNGPLTGTYRAGEHLTLRGFPTISRADTAHFMVREVETAAFVRKVVIVSY
jgi:putative NADH-flavin reductase